MVCIEKKCPKSKMNKNKFPKLRDNINVTTSQGHYEGGNLTNMTGKRKDCVKIASHAGTDRGYSAPL